MAICFLWVEAAWLVKLVDSFVCRWIIRDILIQQCRVCFALLLLHSMAFGFGCVVLACDFIFGRDVGLISLFFGGVFADHRFVYCPGAFYAAVCCYSSLPGYQP